MHATKHVFIVQLLQLFCVVNLLQKFTWRLFIEKGKVQIILEIFIKFYKYFFTRWLKTVKPHKFSYLSENLIKI